MKNVITIIILLITLSSCAQTKKCSDFKTGEFQYIDKSLPFKITRNDTLQIERNLNTGLEIHSSLKWKSDCEYVLTYKKILNSDQNVDGVIGKQIFVEILKIDDNKITIHAKSDAIDDQFEMIKID